MDTGLSIISDKDKFICVLLEIFILNILILGVALSGASTDWFTSLNKGGISETMMLLLYGMGTVMGYIGMIIFYTNKGTIKSYWPTGEKRSLYVTYLFLIGAFITLAWVIFFFYYQNIRLSLYLLSVPFAFTFWLFIYMWNIVPIAAIFLLPIMGVYIYLFYWVARIGIINNIPL